MPTLYATAVTPQYTGHMYGYGKKTIIPHNGKAGTFDVSFASRYNEWCSPPTCHISATPGTRIRTGSG